MVKPTVWWMAGFLVGCSGGASDVIPAVEAPTRVIGVPNVDRVPFSREQADDDDKVFFEVASNTGIRTNWWRLTLQTPRRFVRVWQGEEVLLDQGTEEALVEKSGPLELAAEFGDFARSTTLVVEELDWYLNVVSTTEIVLESSPLFLNHHLLPSELVMAVEVGGPWANPGMINGYEDALGNHFQVVEGDDYGGDVWLQDEIELAWAVGHDGVRMDVAIDSIRDRGLDDMPEDVLQGNDFAVLTWGEGFANTLDSFGNLEITPPIEGYPLGRIYYGAIPGYAPNDQVLFDKLEEQELQDPFQIDTSWLCVGHVDEFMSFVPDATAPRGFRMIYTDTTLGWDLFASMDPATELPRWAGRQNHDYDDVGQILDDAGLQQFNDGVQRTYLDPILDGLISELGLQPEEIVMIPGLFEQVGYCGGTAAALVPGMANLVVSNEAGSAPKVFMPDPFTRTDLGNQAEDPFIAEVAARMPADIELHFLDDWVTYHLALGEVHCGSNVIRTPEVAWWDLVNAGGDE
ncbi:MAG: protein-arginine deiminase domain-containing protein [Myxococcales bacterium]|nr:protein-arginine deiminase domain-containing protein [Myxococcales bacterium]